MNNSQSMQDYIYIDDKTSEIILVCLACQRVIEADYQFKNIMGLYPWQMQNVVFNSEKTGLEIIYITND